jgi:4'-phosphopantetheinyl transferase
MTQGRREAAPVLDESVVFDPTRPLYIGHARGPLTLAVVSIAWLRAQTCASRTAIETRHLSAEEAAYAARLRVPKRRFEWLAGRLAVKHGVREYWWRHNGTDLLTGVSTCDIRVRTVPSGMRAGKPVVDGPVEIGLSHSADFAIAACGPRGVGVDLELSREMAPMLTELLAVDTDHLAGADALATMPASLRWACKEAVLKYFGFGLRVDTREVGLTAWRSDGRFSWTAGPVLRGHAPSAADGWRFDSWAREVDGYSIALVWR